MEFDKTGHLLDYRIVRGVIKSAKRFTYSEAKQILDGTKKSPHKKMLDEMVELCHLLKKKRFERGSIEFSLPEIRLLIDDEGNPYGTKLISYDITHQMVEEFMLKANELVAWHLCNEGKNVTYRVHEEPSEESMKDFTTIARSFGYDLPKKPTPEQLQELFQKSQKTSYGPYLTTSFIRSMRMATYSPENVGHFGLSLTHYCHFTSPIRRYVDLVVHRLLFGGDKEYDDICNVASACSEQERISGRAESSVLLLKKLRLLKALQKEDPHQHFNAVVTQVKPFGFFFELIDLLIEGMIHVSQIGNDFYEYDEKRLCLEGRRTGDTFCPGDPIEVALGDLDLITLQTEWYLV